MFLPALAYHYYTTRRGWQGRQRFLEDLTIELPDDEDWIPGFPREARKLKRVLSTLDPVFILLQAMGFEVGKVLIGQWPRNLLQFDRQEMTVTLADRDQVGFIPYDIFPTPGLTGSKNMEAADMEALFPNYDYRGLETYRDARSEAKDAGHGHGESIDGVTIAIHFSTNGFLGYAGTHFIQSPLKNLKFFEDHGYLYIFLNYGGFDGERDHEDRFASFLRQLAKQVGSDQEWPRYDSIRHLLISKVVESLSPGGVLGAEHDPLSSEAVACSGLIWDPSNWLFPNLWLEDRDAYLGRVESYRTLGPLFWSHITRSAYGLRSFLVYETAGFGPGSQRVRSKTVSVLAQLANIEDGTDYDRKLLSDPAVVRSGASAPEGKLVWPGQVSGRELLRDWIERTNAYQATTDKQLVTLTPKSLRFSEISRFTYTELLTTTYRHGGIDFRGAASQGGWGLRLPGQGLSPELAAEMRAAGVGINEISHQRLQQMQMLMYSAWRTLGSDPLFAADKLRRIRLFLESEGNSAREERFGTTTGSWESERLAAIIEDACRAIRLFEFKLQCQISTSPLDYEELERVFQHVGAALVSLDPVFIYLERELTPGNIFDKFATGFLAGVGGDPKNKAYQLFDRQLGHIYYAPLFQFPYLAGIVVGAAEYLDKTILNILKFVDDPAKEVGKIIDAIRQLLDTYLIEIIEGLGNASGQAAAKYMDDLLACDSWWAFAYLLGKIVAPLVVSIILELIFQAYVVAPLLQAGALALRATVRAIPMFGDEFIAANRGVIKGAGLAESALDVDLDDIGPFLRNADAPPETIPDLPDGAINILDPDIPDPDRSLRAPKPDNDFSSVPPAVADDPSAPVAGQSWLSDPDKFVDFLDSQLDLGGFFARNLPPGSKVRDILLHTFRQDPGAFAVAHRLLAGNFAKEGDLARVLNVILSSEERAKFLVLLGRSDPPQGIDIAQEMARMPKSPLAFVMGRKATGEALESGVTHADGLLDLIVKCQRNADVFEESIAMMSPANQRRFRSRWNDADMLDVKFKPQVELHELGMRARGRRVVFHKGDDTEILRERFAFTSQKVKLPDTSRPPMVLDDGTRVFHQIEADVAHIAEGWIMDGSGKLFGKRSPGEVRAQANSTKIPRDLKLRANTTVPNLNEKEVLATIDRVSINVEGIAVDAADLRNPFGWQTQISGRDLDDFESYISFGKGLLKGASPTGQWHGGHIIARVLGPAFEEALNLIPVNWRVNLSLQAKTENDLLRLFTTKGGKFEEGDIYLKAEVIGPWENGVPLGVRYRAYHIDDATTTITEVLDATVTVDTFLFDTGARMMRWGKAAGTIADKEFL